MTLETTVSVTAAHIDHGMPSNCSLCPIALAIGDAISQPVDVSVFGREAVLFVGEARYEASLPHAAVHFIHRFDHADPVLPFEFTLRWEDPS